MGYAILTVIIFLVAGFPGRSWRSVKGKGLKNSDVEEKSLEPRKIDTSISKNLVF